MLNGCIVAKNIQITAISTVDLYEWTNRGTGWSNNVNCPVLPNCVCVCVCVYVYPKESPQH